MANIFEGMDEFVEFQIVTGASEEDKDDTEEE